MSFDLAAAVRGPRRDKRALAAHAYRLVDDGRGWCRIVAWCGRRKTTMDTPPRVPTCKVCIRLMSRRGKAVR